ncbi:MAG: DUF1269 domain-containing protein [Chloroflexi bacterium]|nr:DUF1269 domain-containing protein [Chloroflexota bacterium]
MSDLVVVAFDNETDAEKLQAQMKRLQKEHLVTLEDAAVVVRKADGKVKVKQSTSLVGAGALGGAFWGLLIGLVFRAMWWGLAIGAVLGALRGKFKDIGIDDKFIKEVGETIQPGNSAIFLLIRESTPDKLIDELKGYKDTVLKTSLSTDDEAKLRAAFGAEA